MAITFKEQHGELYVTAQCDICNKFIDSRAIVGTEHALQRFEDMHRMYRDHQNRHKDNDTITTYQFSKDEALDVIIGMVTERINQCYSAISYAKSSWFKEVEIERINRLESLLTYIKARLE